MNRIVILLITLTLYGCYGINSETSEIGSMSPSCLDSLAWEKICQEYSIDSITDPNLISRLEDVRNHFIKPDYILYFDEEPKEIIGCDWYSIRVVYNEKIADRLLTGLSPSLSNKEQKRIRNRVFAELMKYQCEDGKPEMIKAMKMEVPFAESHKDYPLKSSPVMMEAIPEEN